MKKMSLIIRRSGTVKGYKVKINDIQWYDLDHIKSEELSDDISKFPPVTHYIDNYFLFSLSPLTRKN